MLVTILGITFKENVPDIRNSRVIDIVRELRSFGVTVQVADPLADAAAVEHEYGLALTTLEALQPADAVILAVAHDRYVEGGWPLIQGLLRERQRARARRQDEARSQHASRPASNCGDSDGATMSDNTVLVTGAAGFIGFHVAQRLLPKGRQVVGLDSVNDYYDPQLKEARLDILKAQPGFTFVKLDLADRAAIKSLFAQHRFPRRGPSRGAGRRALFARESARLCRCQSRGLHQRARRLPAQWLRASACLHRRRRSMAPTPSCRFRCRTMSIIRSASMPRPRRPTS